MKRCQICTALSFLFLACVAFAVDTNFGQSFSTATVVSFSPANGATGVNVATTTKLTVTFSEPMDQHGYSFVIISGRTFPPTAGTAVWRNSKTIELPVALAPGKTYTLGLNGGSHMNFKDVLGRPLNPVVWSFTTRRGALL